MARYTSSRPRGWIEDDVYADPARLDIVVSEAGPVDTGLLDAGGNAIFRIPNPIGFGRDEEW